MNTFNLNALLLFFMCTMAITVNAQTPYTYQLDSIVMPSTYVNQYFYNEVGNVMRSEYRVYNPLDQTYVTSSQTLMSYTEDNLIEEELKQQYNNFSQIYINEARTTYSYTNSGLPAAKENSFWNLSSETWIPESGETWTYTPEGWVEQHSVYTLLGGVGPYDVSLRFTYTYSDEGLVETSVQENYDMNLQSLVNQTRMTYTYISDEWVEIYIDEWNPGAEAWEPSGKNEVEYTNGLTVTRTFYNFDGSAYTLSTQTTYSYNDFNVQEAMLQYVMTENGWREHYAQVYTFDALGNALLSSTSLYNSQQDELLPVSVVEYSYDTDFEMSATALPETYRQQNDLFRSHLTEVNFTSFWEGEPMGGGTELFYYSAFSPVTHVSEVAALNVEVYPNPATDVLRLSAEDTSAPLRMVLTDINGRRVMDQVVQTSDLISVAHLTQGMYLYHITSATQSASGKLVVR